MLMSIWFACALQTNGIKRGDVGVSFHREGWARTPRGPAEGQGASKCFVTDVLIISLGDIWS